MDSNMGSGPQPQPLQVITVDGDSTSETHELMVCSTLYNTFPNVADDWTGFNNEGKPVRSVSAPFHEAIEVRR